MPTVIDSLVVQLIIDPAGFIEGRKTVSEGLKRVRDDAGATAKELEAQGKRGGEFYNQLAKGATAFFTVMAGTDLTRFAISQVNSISGMSRAALALGMSIQSVDAFAKAVERVGGTRQGATGTLQSLRGMTENARLFGQLDPRQAMVLGKIGATTSDDPLEIIKRFADYTRSTKDTQADITAYGNILGLDEGTQNLARTRGRTGIDAEMRKAPTIDDAEAARAQKAQYDLHLALQTLTTDLDKLGLSSDAAVAGVAALLVALKGFGYFKAGQFVMGGGAPAAAAGGAGGGEVAAGTAAGLGLTVGSAALALAGGVGLALIPTKLGDGTIAGMNPYGINNPKAHARLFYMKTHGGAEPPADFWTRFNADMAGKGGAAAQGGGSSSGGGSGLFARLEAQYGLPRGILDAVWYQESRRGKNLGPSSKGAQGHFQFMPGTAAEYGLKHPNDLGESADAAARYLRRLLGTYGNDESKALANYNWGSKWLNHDIAKNGADWLKHAPRETRDYVRQIEARQGGGTNVTIQNLTINAPNARDAGSATKAGIEASLKRSSLAMQANGAYR